MTLAIPNELDSFIQDQVRTGCFASEQEVVVAALQMMRSDMREALIGIQAGLADAAAGRMQPVAEVFAELRSKD